MRAIRFQKAAWCVAFLVVLTTGSSAWADLVKMSRSAICHCPGGAYYERTIHFTGFETVDACLRSGGRHPKQGQGDCQSAGQGAGDATIPLSTPITGEFTQPYDRDALGGWTDITGDCRDTRHELLADLSTGLFETTPNGCEILRGRWNDPYTGQVFTNAGEMDVDHVVPLYYAWRRGAAEWDTERRVRFANDPANLIATDASTNRRKGARGPLDWLPPNPDFHCQYVLRFRRIAHQYELVIPDQEATSMGDLSREVCREMRGHG